MSRAYTTGASFPANEPGEDRRPGFVYEPNEYLRGALWSPRNKQHWVYLQDERGGDARHLRKLMSPRWKNVTQSVTGVRPRNEREMRQMWANMPQAQLTQLVVRANNMADAEAEQAAAIREPARPFEMDEHRQPADRITNFERRNPGKDKDLDPFNNPNEQQRLALEQSARFLPAELLHMIRPDRKPQPPLSDHPAYHSAPARTIRQRINEPVNSDYVHH